MSRSAAEYLCHILDEAEYLIKFAKGKNFEDFIRDQTLHKAFVRSLEIIGEATIGTTSKRYVKVGLDAVFL